MGVSSRWGSLLHRHPELAQGPPFDMERPASNQAGTGLPRFEPNVTRFDPTPPLGVLAQSQ
eukprot:4394926-Heterocapsa_arctica.AAC.1